MVKHLYIEYSQSRAIIYPTFAQLLHRWSSVLFSLIIIHVWFQFAITADVPEFSLLSFNKYMNSTISF